MAGNGSNAHLEKLEVAIRGVTPAPQAVPGDDLLARVSAALDMCREIGRYTKDHGGFVDQLSTSFADHVQHLTDEYCTKVMEAERRKLAELEKIMGKVK